MTEPTYSKLDTSQCHGEHIHSDQLLEKFETRVVGSPFRLEEKCFHGEYLSKNVDFSGIQLNYSSFEGANLIEAEFERAELRETIFRNSKLNSANFTGAYLVGADFTRANLSNAVFTNANLLRAKLDLVDLTGTVFANTEITWESFGRIIRAEMDHNFLVANEIYRNLRQNFEAIGDYDSASWSYYRERVCRYKSHGIKYAFENYGSRQKGGKNEISFLQPIFFWFRNKSWLYWLNGTIQNALWGFAQKPFRVLFWAFFNVFLFAFTYWKYHLVCTGNGKCIIDNSVLALEHYLLFSLAAFSTSSIPNLIGSNEMANTLSSIEGVLGVTFLALFTTSLASKLGGT